ncbi:hypothetical protein ARMSODRAFT_355204 [Armillaria solidipes]|uniref:Uncharacterized protein n=1 Tax=Armillaria solidipes TaxID=1076256 RepID=A0A2H3B5T8_9AGAR|nr:hypothetical protein ARMSODRAFT_355204 [Armillaria solidipes]
MSLRNIRNSRLMKTPKYNLSRGCRKRWRTREREEAESGGATTTTHVYLLTSLELAWNSRYFGFLLIPYNRRIFGNPLVHNGRRVRSCQRWNWPRASHTKVYTEHLALSSTDAPSPSPRPNPYPKLSQTSLSDRTPRDCLLPPPSTRALSSYSAYRGALQQHPSTPRR